MALNRWCLYILGAENVITTRPSVPSRVAQIAYVYSPETCNFVLYSALACLKTRLQRQRYAQEPQLTRLLLSTYHKAFVKKGKMTRQTLTATCTAFIVFWAILYHIKWSKPIVSNEGCMNSPKNY